MQFSEEKKAPLDRVGRKVKKKIIFFLGSGPKIGSVGTWETDNQLDVPLGQEKDFMFPVTIWKVGQWNFIFLHDFLGQKCVLCMFYVDWIWEGGKKNWG